ncbi:MAG: cysteine hydrolase [Deltaproteobacteria bacterium]|nr:MAG: cysteine hydrolase [Deltaproteobacteria bacterium]
MRPAVIIVDMVKDNMRPEFPIAKEAEVIIPRINRLLEEARGLGMPVIFACDSFLPDDFIFKGKMKPHALRGTEGSQVTERIVVRPSDVYLPKRRFSAFFKTDLDQTLRTWGVDTVAVGGITTNVCVLMTVMDALCHDFYVVWLEDCCAAHKREVHEATLNLYRKFALWPLLRIMTSEEFIKEVREEKG